MSKTILLTGASGYLGGYLAKYFSTQGYSIIGISRDNKIPLRQIFEENKIDIVIHTATLYGRQGEAATELLRTNVLFPLEILELASEFSVEMFINTDTILAKYISVYALTKNQFTDWLSMYSDKIKCVNLGLDHFFGPNDKPIKFVAYLIEQLKNNVPEIKLTEGLQKRDFIYIDDVVEAYACIVENIHKLETAAVHTFEVGTDVKTSIKELALLLKSLTQNTQTTLNFGAIPYRKHEIFDYEVDTQGLKMLGWTSKVTLRQGLEEVLKQEVLA